MRTMLWQFAALYGFIFAGVGLPSLIGTLAKRAIGSHMPKPPEFLAMRLGL